MRVPSLILIVYVFTLFNAYAQVIGGSDYKLAKLYNAGKYESCLLKADNLTYKEDSKRDPEPYLYMSMCFYELSKSDDPVLKEDYKNGLKQSIKYAGKFIKKDKTGEMYSDNIEFINTLKEIQYTTANNYFNSDEYKKAASSSKVYTKLVKDKDFGILYFIGINEILSNNSQGARNIDIAKAEIESQLKVGNFKIDNNFKPLLSLAFLKYSDYLVNENQLKTASENISFGIKVLPGEASLKAKYDEISKKLEGTKK